MSGSCRGWWGQDVHHEVLAAARSQAPKETLIQWGLELWASSGSARLCSQIQKTAPLASGCSTNAFCELYHKYPECSILTLVKALWWSLPRLLQSPQNSLVVSEAGCRSTKAFWYFKGKLDPNWWAHVSDTEIHNSNPQDVLLPASLDFSKPTLTRVLKLFNPPTSSPVRGRGKERLIGNGDVSLFRSHSSGWFLSSMSGYQQCQWLDPEGTLRLCWTSTSSRMPQGAARIPQVRFSLWSRDKRRSAKTSEALQGEPMQERPLRLCAVKFTSS